MQYSLLTLQNFPRRNIFFTAHDDTLQKIHAQFSKTPDRIQKVALRGLAGIGKTHLAIEYAHRFFNAYTVVLWINASSKGQFDSDIVTIAKLLDMPEKDEQELGLLINFVRQWLTQCPRWLLILDDVKDEELLKNFIPSTGSGHVLITTQLQGIKDIHEIEVRKMTDEEGALFLLRRTRIIPANADDDPKLVEQYVDAKKISQLSDGLPLALDQAGAFIEETSCGFSKYLERYERQRAILLGRRGEHYIKSESVSSTWLMSINTMKKTQPLVIDVLRLCAFLSPDAIPEELLLDGVHYYHYASQGTSITREALSDAISLLCRFSFLQHKSNDNMLSIHHLLQLVIQDDMEEHVQYKWAECALLIVNNAFPPIVFNTWNLCQRYLPQAKACVNLIEKFTIQTVEAAHLLRETAFYLFERVHYDEVEKLYQRTLDIQEVLEPEQEETATTYHNLALFYREQARYDEAEALFREAFNIRKQRLGLNNSYTASSLHQLGWIYNAKARYEKAEKLLQQALDIRLQCLSPEHQDIATSLNELGQLFRHRAMYEKAQESLQQARSIREKVLGLGHPHTAQTLVDLAWVYYEINELGEAETLLFLALDIQKNTLNQDHPRIARTLNSLGMLYCVLNRFKQAGEFYNQALAICKRVLSFEHPLLAQTYDNQGLLNYHQKDYIKSEELYKQALNIRSTVLGPNHPDTAQTLNHLGQLYFKRGLYSEARNYFEDALKARRAVLGPRHPYVATCLNYLARLHASQENYTQAEELYKQALNIRVRVWTVHPRIAQTLRDLAELYTIEGRYAEAEDLYSNALVIYKQTLPADHPLVAKVLADYEEVLKQRSQKHREEL